MKKLDTEIPTWEQDLYLEGLRTSIRVATEEEAIEEELDPPYLICICRNWRGRQVFIHGSMARNKNELYRILVALNDLAEDSVPSVGASVKLIDVERTGYPVRLFHEEQVTEGCHFIVRWDRKPSRRIEPPAVQNTPMN